MYAFILIVVFYAIMFVVSKELSKSEHYVGAMILSSWMLIDYLCYDNWTLMFLLTVISGIAGFFLSYQKAKRLDEGYSFATYVQRGQKIANRKQEKILFWLAFIVCCPLICKFQKDTYYVIWIPVAFFIIERCLYLTIRKNKGWEQIVMELVLN